MKKLQKIVMVVATLTLVATTQASPTDELIDRCCLKLLSKEVQQVDDLNFNRRKVEDQVQKLKTRPSADVNANIIVELENQVRIMKDEVRRRRQQGRDACRTLASGNVASCLKKFPK